MEDYFRVLVKDDTLEEWTRVMAEMPWSWRASREYEDLVIGLGLEPVGMLEDDHADVLGRIIDDSEDGTLLLESSFQPSLLVNGAYYPMIRDATGLSILPKGSRPGGFRYGFNYVFRSARAVADLPEDCLVYMLIHCPRCHLSFSKGDEYFFATGDIDPAECVLEDCIACQGLGEWVYQAPFMPRWDM